MVRFGWSVVLIRVVGRAHKRESWSVKEEARLWELGHVKLIGLYIVC